MRNKYSLRKIKNLTYQLYQWYLKHGKEFTEQERLVIEKTFVHLDQALLDKDKTKANDEYSLLELATEQRRSTPFWKYPIELIGALAVALLVATIIRQMVFEPYEIPSGSMRPTFKEKDHLVVSKTTFGVNIPFTPKHFYFDESLLPRGGVIVFSGEGIDLTDTDTKYFWLFPAKKRYIKRCMGKPYDSLYFYGGLIYGVDKEGNDLPELRGPPFNETLDHVPFNMFEGMKVSRNGGGKKESPFEITYRHFNKPIGKITFSNTGEIDGLVFNGTNWVKDQPMSLKTPHNEIKTFSDYYGMVNIAMVRLLNKEEMAKLHPNTKVDGNTALYLELAHTPRLEPLGLNNKKTGSFNITGQLAYETSLIPLTTENVKTLMENLYTARFTVIEGRAHRFDNNGFDQYDIPLPNVPNGTYEFYDGKAHQIGFLGWRTLLPKTHPIYHFTSKTTQHLFNNGIEFSTLFNPTSSYYAPFPARYAYFREGDLYVMGRKLLDKNTPQLIQFVESENSKGKGQYIPFVDRGAPLKEGKIDVEFIRKFGYTLGDKEYLALGDNYAMSADSRTFGPVPQGNLEGTPAFIVWPPQERFGSPNVIPYNYFSWPTIGVWSLFIASVSAFLWYEKRKKALPIFKHGV